MSSILVSSEAYEPEVEPIPQPRPFILLWGKAFTKSPEVCSPMGSRSNTSNSPIQLYDIYPMVCWLLGLERPWINMGKLSRVKKYFKNPPYDSQIADFESRCKDWDQDSRKGRFGVTSTTLVTGRFEYAAYIVLNLNK